VQQKKARARENGQTEKHGEIPWAQRVVSLQAFLVELTSRRSQTPAI
jgi:hypothetical protein